MLIRTQCCGVHEYHGLKATAEESLKTMFRYRYLRGFRGAYIVFSDPIDRGHGIALARYIQENALGTLSVLDTGVNPNTARRLGVWVYQPDDSSASEWFELFKKEQDVIAKKEDQRESELQQLRNISQERVFQNARRVRDFEEEHANLISSRDGYKERYSNMLILAIVSLTMCMVLLTIG
jgi:hypothetical protein